MALKLSASRREKFYVLYKGDEILCSGSIEEISQKTGKSIPFLIWITFPAVHKQVDAKGEGILMVEAEED